MNKIFILVACVFATLSCKPRRAIDTSDTSGFSQRQMQQDAQGRTAKPQYNLLPADAGDLGGEDPLKVAVFFSYDQSFHNAFGDNRLPAAHSIVGGGQKDHAVVAYNTVISWFKDKDQNGKTFFTDPSKTTFEEIAKGTPHYQVLIEGYRPKLGGGKTVKWQINVYLGYVEKIAKLFGNAIAENHITLLNGHFYPDDLSSAETSMGNEFGRFLSQTSSRIYQPAMDEFKAAAPHSSLPYRIVVFNGCYSEPIEDLVLQTASEASKSTNDTTLENIDIISNRGRSNYRFFGQQVAGFFNALIGGKTWVGVLPSFEITGTGYKNFSIPVFRNRYIGATPSNQWPN
jgi:hypothetical protein